MRTRWAAVILVLAFWLIAGCHGEQSAALSACEDAASQHAGNLPAVRVLNNETHATKNAQGYWTVIGAVETRNTAGLAVRLDYTCTTQPDSSGRWQVLSLTSDVSIP